MDYLLWLPHFQSSKRERSSSFKGTFHKHKQKIEEEQCSNLLYVVSINLISKSDKSITMKKNYTLIYLINMHAEILNKILAN